MKLNPGEPGDLPRLARTWALRLALSFLLLLPSYALTAYVLLPASWQRCARRVIPSSAHPVSYTAEGIPADPINVGLVGTRGEIISAMRAAGWTLADPISLRSGLRDAQSVLFGRNYPSAPMSTHYLARRRHDLGFEQSAGKSPRRRHHVRLWKASTRWGRTLWIGAATFDLGVGVSKYTGEVMHHIDPNVDAERTKLVADLVAAGRVARVDGVSGPAVAVGTNGGGDVYRTDGRFVVAVLKKSVVASR